AKMKPGSIIVNCARGGLIDEYALATSLAADAGNAEAADVLDQLLMSVVGIQCPQFWLNWRASFELVLIMFVVQDSGQADSTVGIN
ncbi:MAG TPA: hypothetical protein EYQ75_08000, partial [Planctomycetaceae bacterium]|nr:hypothetical protein [Planctomycetaceae bacterium]